jgi:hypothetical protein
MLFHGGKLQQGHFLGPTGLIGDHAERENFFLTE